MYSLTTEEFLDCLGSPTPLESYELTLLGKLHKDNDPELNHAIIQTLDRPQEILADYSFDAASKALFPDGIIYPADYTDLSDE